MIIETYLYSFVSMMQLSSKDYIATVDELDSAFGM